MLLDKPVCTRFLAICVLFILLFTSCSNQKNTAMTRFYHSINTRYNIHFNAEEAYKETLKTQNKSREDNLSQRLYIFPDNSDSTALQSARGNYTTTIDKTTKAIKLHSIKAKPKRDPNRRNDKEYQDWLQQKEYTPFMDKVWLLLAKAEFHEGNYLRAITTFMYISKIYSTNANIVAETQLWIARAYTEMGWMYEAGNVLHKIELAGGIADSQKPFYSAVKANYLIRNNESSAAIPYLRTALKGEKDKLQKLRLKYLLGQLYAETGDNTLADKAFASVQGMNTPYKYTINAKLQQLQLDPALSKKDAIASLTKMGKSAKNKEYLDQIYFAIGNLYLQNLDTLKAVDNYKLAIKESTRNGYDKMIAEVTLGDLYFVQRKFVSAQPLYASAIEKINKTHEAYPRVALRSDVLDELVVHVVTVQTQDSLQHLAQLPEEERLSIINKKIEELKKQEEEKLKNEARQVHEEEAQNRMSTWADLESASNNQQPVPPVPTSNDNTNSFYFYNEQAVNQGKIAFQKQWGNRKLEDDWRRRNKSNISMDLADMNEFETDTLSMSDKTPAVAHKKGDKTIDDIYSVEYYLQQLPFTAKAIKESNDLIENALFNMGKIYKDKLKDMNLSIEAFSTDINRFPNTPNLEEIYYQLLLIYMQTGNQNMMGTYRNKLLSEFPNRKYAPPLSDPNYEWNFKHMPIIEDSLYTAAYNAYLIADVQTVRNNYQDMKTKYPFTDLMPKFELLNALSYAQTRDIENLGDNLKKLTEDFPKADVTPLATDILQRIKDGKIILSDGTPITEFDWSKAYLGSNSLTDEDGKALAFSNDPDSEFILLLMFKSNTIDRNELLYEVADYNFSNYVIQTFDLNFDTDPPYDILQIKGFKSFANIRSYLVKALSIDGLINRIDTGILTIPISIENYTKVLPKLGLEQYITYLTENYNETLPQLIAYWDRDKTEVETLTDLQEQTIPSEKHKEEIQQPEEIIVEVIQPEKTKQPVNKVDEQKASKKQDNDKQITADDLLTKEQLEKAEKVNEAIETVEDIISNPVDGIKNLFNKNKNRNNLSKEEKAALKEQEKLEKQRLKELKAIEKAKQDSINKIEKILQDSIKAVELQKEQQIKLEADKQKNAEKAAQKAKEEEERKQKEIDRKNRIQQQKEQQRLQEKERKEKEKTREAERKEKERLQKERLKQREKERDEKEKAKEKERKEKEKNSNG